MTTIINSDNYDEEDYDQMCNGHSEVLTTIINSDTYNGDMMVEEDYDKMCNEHCCQI